MQEYYGILKECALFEEIGEENVGAMLGCLGARIERRKKNEVILEEGAPARDVGILLEGAAQVIRVDYYGNRSIMMRLEPGDLFGESFACAEVAALPVQVVAEEDTAVMMVDCRRLLTSCSHACEFHSRMIFNLLRIVARKNLHMHRRAEITSRRTTRDKLMAYLLMQAKEQRSSTFTIALDRQGLADYLEVDRSGLSAEIGKLRREGILDCHRNSFRILREA